VEAATPELRSSKAGGVPASWTEKGSFVDHSTSSSNKSKTRMDQNGHDGGGGGGDDDDDNSTIDARQLSHYWSQDRLTVNVRILLDHHDHHHRDVQKPSKQPR